MTNSDSSRVGPYELLDLHHLNDVHENYRFPLAVGLIATGSGFVEHGWRLVAETLADSRPANRVFAGQPMFFLLDASCAMARGTEDLSPDVLAKIEAAARTTRDLGPRRNRYIHGYWSLDGEDFQSIVSKKWTERAPGPAAPEGSLQEALEISHAYSDLLPVLLDIVVGIVKSRRGRRVETGVTRTAMATAAEDDD